MKGKYKILEYKVNIGKEEKTRKKIVYFNINGEEETKELYTDNYTIKEGYQSVDIGSSFNRNYETSSTTLKTPNEGDIVLLNTQTNLEYTEGQYVVVSSDSFANNDYFDFEYSYFHAKIDYYNKTTGDLNLITESSNLSGITHSYWYITLNGGAKGEADVYSSISRSTFTIPEPGKLVNLQTETNLAYKQGQSVLISPDQDFGDDDYYDEFDKAYFNAEVDYYNRNTGDMQLISKDAQGIGVTYSQWFINLSAEIPTSGSLDSLSLPAPKVKLIQGTASIKYLQIESGITYTENSFSLKSYPVISTQDLNEAHIELAKNNLLFVEMVHYRRKTKKSNTTKNYSGYVTAGVYYETWPDYLPWSQNFWVRNNSASTLPKSNIQTSNIIRENFYQIINHNIDVPVYNILNNRFHEEEIVYRSDYNNTYSTLLTIIPSVGYNRSSSNKPSNIFSYSSWYTPYYIAFRYIIYDKDNNKIISGPLSNTVKITHEYFPFRNSPVLSETDLPFATINPIYQKLKLKCRII